MKLINKPIGKQWRLKSGLLYSGVKAETFSIALVGPDQATVYDGRDNREMKKRFAEQLLGVRFEVEEIA